MYKIVSKGLNQQKLVPADFNIEDLIAKDPNHDYYEGFYLWDENHKKKWDEVKSMKGFTGAHTKKLVFDFDSEDNIENAKQDTLELVSRLIHNGMSVDQMQISFSGHKGFHVEFNTTESFTRKEFEATVKGLAGDLKTFDHKIINETRIFRVPLTKNVHTNGYKIPITIDELSGCTISQIQEKSKNAESHWDELCGLINTAEVELPSKIKAFKIVGKPKLEVVTIGDQGFEDRPNLTAKPKFMSAARYTLQEGFFEAGERNEAYMILAATYKALGYNKEIAYNMLKATNRLQGRRTGQEAKSTDELWLNVIEVVYSPTWRGATYSDKDNALLIKTIQKYNLEMWESKETGKISLISDVETRFTNFAENIDKNRILTGIQYVDEDVMLTTGMMVGWLGAPSSGKTSHVLNIVEHNAMNGNHCFFGSFDMYDSLLYTRLVQKYCNIDMMQILDMMKKKTPSKELRDAFQTVKSNFKNVGFNFQSGPTVEDIGKSIDEYQHKTGEKLRLVVVDYLEKLSGPYSDGSANSGYNAARLSDLAKDKDVCLITLLQPQKSAGDVSEPLTTYRKVKGASIIEQDARVIIANWRPGCNPMNDNVDDKYASLAILKNNMGPIGKYDFAWDGISGRTRIMTVDEEQDLKRIVGEANARKAQKSDDLY